MTIPQFCCHQIRPHFFALTWFYSRKKGDTDIYTKGNSSPESTFLFCDKPINIMLKQSFTFPIVDVLMSGSWSLLRNGNTSVCVADATPLAFLFVSSVADSWRDGLNKIILANIYIVLKILSPEASLVNHFFTPSTSLILIADPNISLWIRSITSEIHSENIWGSGYLAERYSDPAIF